MRVCVRSCVRSCVRVRACVCVCVRVCVCAFTWGVLRDDAACVAGNAGSASVVRAKEPCKRALQKSPATLQRGRPLQLLALIDTCLSLARTARALQKRPLKEPVKPERGLIACIQDAREPSFFLKGCKRADERFVLQARPPHLRATTRDSGCVVCVRARVRVCRVVRGVLMLSLVCVCVCV